MRTLHVEIDDSQQYSQDFIYANKVLKLSENESEVIIAASGEIDHELRLLLVDYHFPKRTIVKSVKSSDFAEYIGSDSIKTVAIEKEKKASGVFQLELVSQDAPVVNIINAIFIDAIKQDSSDIHIEATGTGVQVRYRIDGVLRTVKKFQPDIFATLASRIKIMSNMNIMEQRLPQDGRFSVEVEGVTIDIRVSIVPVTHGESIVLRIFEKDSDHLRLPQLGFSSGQVETLKLSLKNPSGMILVTGPTGSGKTTTLHSLIEELDKDQLKIITIEDPVEKNIKGINQIQVNDDINLSFGSVLRRVLRQDPNVIMIGEVRDSETIEVASRSALTGHLILTSLHTNDSISSITRLKNMGIDAFLIASVLRFVIAQRLVRRLCTDCSVKTEAPAEALRFAKKYKVELSSIWKPVGCEKCFYSGYRGRIAVSEMFFLDEKVRKRIIAGDDEDSLRSLLVSSGMRTLAVDALEKVSAGITSIDEVSREVIL